MILSDSTLLTLAFALAIVALMAGALLYWINEPEKVKGMGRTAFKLILSLTSYPCVVVGLIITFALQLIATILRYTAARISGEPLHKIKVTVTFE